MKVQADKHRTEREFTVGDYAYVKLQPYRQDLLAKRTSYKLSPRYFGPFEVTAKIGAVAYRLKLPDYDKIHPIFHVSALKEKIGLHPFEENLPAGLTSAGQLKAEPIAVL
ncbi:hypothetical protein AXF42_Ash006552 [Apostasia shenzhenica]|uniref:Tf2-1-like SH3-like domain-containing protein n=1 Tax=Apostasia shenzhenica TaxID=1088818 RepID=A0A2I0AZD9_9ASPA|nr:hypothetical protein AXF42_Ash006552 [Apostasia shenzhenica]